MNAGQTHPGHYLEPRLFAPDHHEVYRYPKAPVNDRPAAHRGSLSLYLAQRMIHKLRLWDLALQGQENPPETWRTRRKALHQRVLALLDSDRALDVKRHALDAQDWAQAVLNASLLWDACVWLESVEVSVVGPAVLPADPLFLLFVADLVEQLHGAALDTALSDSSLCLCSSAQPGRCFLQLRIGACSGTRHLGMGSFHRAVDVPDSAKRLWWLTPGAIVADGSLSLRLGLDLPLKPASHEQAPIIRHRSFTEPGRNG